MDYSLIDFLKTFGINTTTNFDLYSIADFLNLDLEICMKNEVAKLYSENIGTLPSALIINYQNKNQKGTHWVCYTNGFYFDSFGLKPLEEIAKHTKKYNKIQVQHFGTKICGILCIYFLYKINGRSEFDETAEQTFGEIILEMKNLYYQISKV